MHKLLFALFSLTLFAAAPDETQPVSIDQSNAPALTIYNQNFFVAREHLPLDLNAGVNHVNFAGISAHLEPDSVILRDLTGRPLQILEQSYRNDPVSQELLLSFYEGKTIDFQVQHGEKTEIIRGKIIRSGYVPISYYQQQNYGYPQPSIGQPIIEVDGVVREKSFDEFHLYTLERTATLRDNETKQVEFVRTTGIQSQRLYVYDGAQIDQYGYYNYEQVRNDPGYGTASNKKIWVLQEFKNSDTNHLGIALPKGRLRFYRRDSDGSLQFVGENTIDHTPKDEMIRAYTGNAFDIVGERKRTNYRVDSNAHWMDETFEMRVRNHKKEMANVRVVEHLYRWTNWKLIEQSHQFKKRDAQTIEFPVTVVPDGEQVVTYTVHYSW